MPRKGQLQKYRKVAPAKPVGPERMARVQSASGLQRYLDEHLEWLAVTHYSPETVRTRRQAIGRFIAWMDERGIDVPSQISRPMIERYQKYLFYYRKPNGQPLSVGMQGQYLAALKLWFKWLTKAHHIGANPASDLDLPRTPKRLPGKILNQTQVQAMLAQADPATAGGLRDRALLELLYASGIRRSEAAKLHTEARPDAARLGERDDRSRDARGACNGDRRARFLFAPGPTEKHWGPARR